MGRTTHAASHNYEVIDWSNEGLDLPEAEMGRMCFIVDHQLQAGERGKEGERVRNPGLEDEFFLISRLSINSNLTKRNN